MPDPHDSWNEALRRIANGEPAEDVIEARNIAERDRFRSILADMGPRSIGALASFDAAMRDSDLGITSARGTWHALSPTQRRALRDAADGYQPDVRIATLRNLERREMLAWDGGAFTPEAKVVITERGRFVLRHGVPSP